MSLNLIVRPNVKRVKVSKVETSCSSDPSNTVYELNRWSSLVLATSSLLLHGLAPSPWMTSWLRPCYFFMLKVNVWSVCWRVKTLFMVKLFVLFVKMMIFSSSNFGWVEMSCKENLRSFLSLFPLLLELSQHKIESSFVRFKNWLSSSSFWCLYFSLSSQVPHFIQVPLVLRSRAYGKRFHVWVH